MPESLETKLAEIVKYAAEVGARAAFVHDSGIFLQIGRFVRRCADLDSQVPGPAEFAGAAEFVTTISGPDSFFSGRRVRGAFTEGAGARQSLTIHLLSEREVPVNVTFDSPVTPGPNIYALQYLMETAEELVIVDPLPYEPSAAHSLFEPAV